MYWFLFIFILLPAIEIGIFIWTGSHIGAWPVVLIIILTGIVGVTLVKKQGLETWRSAQQSMYRQEAPREQIIDGICIIIGGIFLVTPGFVTDFLGFLLVIPWTRRPFKIFFTAMIMKQIAKGKFIYRKW